MTRKRWTWRRAERDQRSPWTRSPFSAGLRKVLLAVAILTVTTSLVWAQSDNYVLGPGDVIAINVFDHPELSMTGIQVRPDGKIAHPFVGEMAVAGLTPGKLAAQVAAGLANELKGPIVTVNVTGFRENRVYVLGQVHAPGAFAAEGPLTVAKAVALAGDLTEKADRRHATLLRKGAEPQALDLEQALGGAGPGGMLRAGDTLIVLPVRNPRVIVWGEVSRPGQYELTQDQKSLMGLLAAAGGLTANADRSQAALLHATGKLEQVDLAALLEDHDPRANLSLQDGDVLTVSPHRNEVMVLGATGKQGAMSFIPGDRVSDVIALSGGLLDTADAENLRIIRPPAAELVVNAKAILNDRNMTANIQLKPGDTIFVPEVRREVLVFGAVGKPGNYPIREGDRLLDVLARAGGFLSDKSAPSKTALVRLEGHEAKVYLVDANEVVRGRALDKNFPLRDRDVIVVPEKSGLDWRELVGVLFQAATMIQIVR